MFFLVQGLVMLRARDLEGRLFTAYLTHPGFTFGYEAFVPEEWRYTPTALTECSYRIVPAELLIRTAREHPFLFELLIANQMQWRAVSLQRLRLAETKSARGKVLGFIREYADFFRSGAQCTVSQQEISLLTGLRPETVSRTLTQLEDAGEIRREDRNIVLLTTQGTRPHTGT